MPRHRTTHLHRGMRGGAAVGDRARGLGRDSHTIEGHFVGVCVAGAILGAHAHPHAMRNGFARMVDHRFFEREPFGATVLEKQIGIIGLAFERVAQNPLEPALVHAESIQEELLRPDQIVRHRFHPSFDPL